METSKQQPDTIAVSEMQAPPGKEEDKVKPFRMYRNRFPDVSDLVMVRIDKVDSDIYANVFLLEYNLEGIIMYSELSSKTRFRSPKSLLQLGKQEVMQVLSVDKEKGYIDLTKRNLKRNEIEQYAKVYNKSKAVHSIVSHVVALQQKKGVRMEMEDLYTSLIWQLYDQYEHAYEAFEKAAKCGEDLFGDVALTDDLKDDILKTVHHRMALHPVKVQADVDVTCFSYEGVDGIIPSLRAAKQLGTDEMPIEIHLTSSPRYALTTAATDTKKATKLLNSAVAAIKAEIVKHGGECVVKTEAHVVG